jgi:prenyl protein peptidase
LAILHLAGVSRTQLILFSPLSFGLGAFLHLLPYISYADSFNVMTAHVHHAWDVFNRYGRTSQAALRALTVTRSSSPSLFLAVRVLQQSYV